MDDIMNIPCEREMARNLPFSHYAQADISQFGVT